MRIGLFLPLFFVVGLTTLVPEATSQETEGDCARQVSEFTPILDPAAKIVKQAFESKINGTEVTESVLLKNGVKVSYVEDGCNDLIYTFIYENVKYPQPRTMKNRLILTQTLMENTPMLKTRYSRLESFRVAIKKALQEPMEEDESGPYSIPCEEVGESCTLDVKDGPNDNVTVSLQDDFSM